MGVGGGIVSDSLISETQISLLEKYGYLSLPATSLVAAKLVFHTESEAWDSTVFLPQQCGIQMYDSSSLCRGRWGLSLPLLGGTASFPGICQWTKGTDTSTSILVMDRRFSCPLLSGRRTWLLLLSLWPAVRLPQGEVVRVCFSSFSKGNFLSLYSRSILFLPPGDDCVCFVEVMEGFEISF